MVGLTTLEIVARCKPGDMGIAGVHVQLKNPEQTFVYAEGDTNAVGGISFSVGLIGIPDVFYICVDPVIDGKVECFGQNTWSVSPPTFPEPPGPVTTPTLGCWSLDKSLFNGGTGTYTIFWLQQICVTEDMLVKLASGIERPISEIHAGDCVVDYNGRPCQVIRNISSGKSSNVVVVPRGTFGATRDLEIRRDHALLIRQHEISSTALIGYEAFERTLDRPKQLFTLCTSRRTFVQMQGMLVATWSLDEALATLGPDAVRD